MGSTLVTVLLEQAMPHLQHMLTVGLNNNFEIIQREATEIKSLPQPPRGDRKLARLLNQEGLDSIKQNDFVKATVKLTNAVLADISDEEVANNFSYALIRSEQWYEAQTAVLKALSLNPVRSSAWYNLGMVLARLNDQNSSYSSFILAYRFSGNQEKTKKWLQKLAQDDPDTRVRAVATKVLSSPLLLTAAPRPEVNSNI